MIPSSSRSDPPGPAPDGDLFATFSGPRGALARIALGVLAASTRFSPRPTAFAIRSLFARTGAETASALRRVAPVDVVVVSDEPIGPRRDDVVDVYLPARHSRPGVRLPTVVWVHGGAFVGGSKEELAGWFRLVADAGFCVVAPRYPLAPQGRHPAPARQVMATFEHLQDEAERLHVDPTSFLLAGDSAGAHIAAQCAAVVTNPAYEATLGVRATIRPDQLRGVVLCCGIYDVTADPTSPFAPFLSAVMWAYSGVRRWRDDAAFLSAMDVGEHVTPAFPPTFVTVGNGDPLAPQSHALADRVEALGVEVDRLLFADDHVPSLGHEYQFHFEHDEARAALDRITAFLQRRAGLADPSTS